MLDKLGQKEGRRRRGAKRARAKAKVSMGKSSRQINKRREGKSTARNKMKKEKLE